MSKSKSNHKPKSEITFEQVARDVRLHYKGCSCDWCDGWDTESENDPREDHPVEIESHYQDCECIDCIRWMPYPDNDVRPERPE